jgi:hypothetical protein
MPDLLPRPFVRGGVVLKIPLNILAEILICERRYGASFFLPKRPLVKINSCALCNAQSHKDQSVSIGSRVVVTALPKSK